MKGALGEMMKQAQKMQDQLKRAQEELAELEVTGEAGGGMVRIVMSGRHDARRVQIDPSLIGQDKEMLEDLIVAAVNDAVRKVEHTSRERLAGLTAGLNLPGDFKLPF